MVARGQIHAIGHTAGVSFYESKERRLLPQRCLEILQSDDAYPEIKFSPARSNATNATDGSTPLPHSQRPRRPPPVPLDRHITSLVPDLGNNLNIFAGTANGSLITLQVSPTRQLAVRMQSTLRLTRLLSGLKVRGEKSRVRCSVLHEVPLLTEQLPSAGRGAHASVAIASLKGFLFATASAPAVTSSLSVLNITALGRANPPELIIYIPLPAVHPWRPAQMHSDRVAGVLVAGAGMGSAGGAVLWEARFPFVQPDKWESYGALQMLRHPLLLGAVGLVVMWNMRSRGSMKPLGRPGRFGAGRAGWDEQDDVMSQIGMMAGENAAGSLGVPHWKAGGMSDGARGFAGGSRGTGRGGVTGGASSVSGRAHY
jgi:hypothetical protein